MQNLSQPPMPTPEQLAKLQLGGPLAILWDQRFRDNLETLGLHLWDTVTGPEVAKAAGIPARRLADWRRSAGPAYLPEKEHRRLFPGAADHYRMDKLLDWIDGRGCRPTDESTLWVGAADFLERTHLGRPGSALEVDDMLNWLWANGLLLPRFTPLILPYHPYSYIAR